MNVYPTAEDRTEEVIRLRQQIHDLEHQNTELQTTMTEMVNSSLHRQVRAFHDAFGVENKTTPEVINGLVVARRLKLISEEYLELLQSCFDGNASVTASIEHIKCAIDDIIRYDAMNVNLPETVDAMADLNYVIEGTAAEFGVFMKPIQNAVHSANMAKLGGTKREDGKILKPEGWKPPDVAGLLKEQGWNGR